MSGAVYAIFFGLDGFVSIYVCSYKKWTQAFGKFIEIHLLTISLLEYLSKLQRELF